MTTTTTPRRWRSSGTPCLLALFALLVPTAPASAQGEQPSETNEEAIALVIANQEKWVETRRLISKEKRDWTLGKELLQERIQLVKDEIALLREQMQKADENISNIDKQRAELSEEKDQLDQAASAFEKTVASLEARAKELEKRLPDPIRKKVKMFRQAIPEDPANTELSLSLRFQNIAGLLIEVDRFQREITETNEVLPLGDGTRAEVKVVYVGLGHAFYVTMNGDAAGVGVPAEDGWSWTPANDAAPAITAALAILNGKEASFVQVPVRVQ